MVANLAIFDIGVGGFRVYCGGSAGTSTDFIVDFIGFYETPLEQALSPAARKFRDSVRRKLRARR